MAATLSGTGTMGDTETINERATDLFSEQTTDRNSYELHRDMEEEEARRRRRRRRQIATPATRAPQAPAHWLLRLHSLLGELGTHAHSAELFGTYP
jgi:hypothetical protein